MEIGFICSIGAAILWGMIYTINQKVLLHIAPLTFLFLNSMLSAVLVLPFLLSGKDAIREVFYSGRMNLLLIFTSIVLATIANLLIFFGIKNLDAATASMIEIAYPFFVVFFSYIFFKSTPNLYFFIGGIFIFIGSAIIIRFA